MSHVPERIQKTSGMPFHRYSSASSVALNEREWPSQRIDSAPVWCSVDLRDGNQALSEPMDVIRKRRMFELLVSMGYKHIEVGFPSSSETDYAFIRELIENGLVPEDVSLQVITPARPELIERTVDSLVGVSKAIIHLYNSVSPVQRRAVFGAGKDDVKKISIEGAQECAKAARRLHGTDVQFQYTPESFSQTELDYALSICNNVIDIWREETERQIIINLPSTVEVAQPNIYADQIEWIHKNIANRDSVLLSVHPHNDRGTGVAAGELARLAGAERIEGCLFGNGERTGNVCLVTLGLNLFTQGIDPEIDFSDIDRIVNEVEFCNQMPVPERHPYGGGLVYTAFSGSHQDAINKGMSQLQKDAEDAGIDPQDYPWSVPYLPIDPGDVGRTYQAVIRINSQSGKGGVGYILENHCGLKLPKGLQVDFSKEIKRWADYNQTELVPETIWSHFHDKYLNNKEAYVSRWSRDIYSISCAFCIADDEYFIDLNDCTLTEEFSRFLGTIGYRVDDIECSTQEIASFLGDGPVSVSYVKVAIAGEEIWGVGLTPERSASVVDGILSAVARSQHAP